nr:SET domain-containing protein-lysine N-methyltransferase [Paraburkholderia podalyriae]
MPASCASRRYSHPDSTPAVRVERREAGYMIIRTLNHACVANCEAVEDNGRVYIQAVSDIQPGEELFIAYGLTTEGRASAAGRAQYACRCGHRRCRGTMLAGSSLRFSDSFKVEQAN